MTRKLSLSSLLASTLMLGIVATPALAQDKHQLAADPVTEQEAKAIQKQLQQFHAELKKEIAAIDRKGAGDAGSVDAAALRQQVGQLELKVLKISHDLESLTGIAALKGETISGVAAAPSAAQIKVAAAQEAEEADQAAFEAAAAVKQLKTKQALQKLGTQIQALQAELAKIRIEG